VVETAAVGIFRCDPKGVCVYVNERWCEFSGLSPEQIVGTATTLSHIHPDDRERVRATWEVTVGTGLPFRCEYRYLQADGTLRWILGQVNEERDADGVLTGYIGTSTDITELHVLREELQKSHAQLEARVRERTVQMERMAKIVEGSDDAIISSDFSGKVVSWNPAAETIFGYTAEEMIGRASLFLTPEDRMEEAQMLREKARAGESARQVETVRVSRSGERIDVALSIFPLRDADGTIIGTSVIVRDIRERRKAELRLRQLSWRLMRSQDEERRRVARELHDSTAQTVAGLAMNLSVLAQGGATLTEKKGAKLLQDSLGLAENAVSDLRSQAYLLHPPLLDERGLNAAMRWFVEGFSERSGIPVEVEIAPNFPRLAEQLEMTIFRVLQESLSNVRRHARSETARIRLALVEGCVQLEIRDRGRGIRQAEAEGLGVGIAGMRERLLQMGGSLSIVPNEPGTAVIARFPQIL
jgi:PAS domain S-box-containing protein